MTTTLTDAAGRTVQAGDHVGGTTSGRYQTTITGPVVQVGTDRVKVLVTNRPEYSGDRPGNGDDVWISTSRLFLIHPVTTRQFVGFRTPDGRTWTQATRVKGVLWEAPMVPQRYEATNLRGMYGADLQPVWEDQPTPIDGIVCDAEGHAIPHGPGCPQGPALTPSPTETRAQAFAEAAARITALPQDWELDPGRGDCAALLERLAAEAHRPDTYPLVLPWALLMDSEDLAAFLRDLSDGMEGAAARAHLTGEPQAQHVLEAVEGICATWRTIAEAQHAHNTAPGRTEPKV